MSGPFTPEQERELREWTRRYPYPETGLIEALRRVQDWHGCVRPEDEVFVAGLFGLPEHRVRSVSTFYPFFTRRPAGRTRIGLCRNLSCQLMGCENMIEHVRRTLGTEEGRATPDGLLSWETVECLGACDHAPAMMVGEELVGAATPESVERALADARAGRPPGRAPIRCLPPAPEVPRLLTAHFGEPELHRLETYRRLGGYAGWEKARAMAPAAIIDELKRSNLRGLGGAGFPTGMKWASVPPKAQRQAPHYLVVNADESEPGCYKDRALLERNPHALIEGMLIAGRAMELDGLYIFVRGEYARQWRILAEAVREARKAGLADREIHLPRGAWAYISGLDTALLETMEGKKAYPRQPPPFPTGYGLMGEPTDVNNVETLMMVPHVIRMGGEAFAKTGFAKSGGTFLFSVSGHVVRPGVYEFPMGTPLPDILAACGGMRDGRPLKAVIPGGVSTPVLTAEEAGKARMDFDSLGQFGSFLGAGGLVFLDDTADMVKVLHVIERFLATESCGQCTPCREGSAWITQMLRRMLDGEALPDELDDVYRVAENVNGKVICALGDTVGLVATRTIDKFRRDFERRLRSDTGPSPAVPGATSGGPMGPQGRSDTLDDRHGDSP